MRELGAGGSETAFPEHCRAALLPVGRAVAGSQLPVKARRVLEELRGDYQIGLGELLLRPEQDMLAAPTLVVSAAGASLACTRAWRLHSTLKCLQHRCTQCF